MAEQRIIEKIKKLLALAKGNANTAEATAAALRAQKLIAEYDVSKAELHDGEPENLIVVESDSNTHGNPWGIRLANAVADNFRCRLYLHTTSNYDRWTGRSKSNRSIVFMGYDTDAEAAKIAFDRLYEIGTKLANAACRKERERWGTATGVRNSFLMGFVKGIRDELEKQSVALVLVRPKAVDDFAEEVTASFRTKRTRVRNVGDSAAYNSGRQAGRDSVRSARLKGQAALNA